MYLYPKPDQEQIAGTLPQFRRTNSLRCSCHEYRLMAMGRSDFMLSALLNPWDHAAGVLAVTEAGGSVGLLDGRDYTPAMTEGRLLSAANGRLWDELAGLWSGVSL